MQFSPHKPHNVPERFAASVAKVCTTAGRFGASQDDYSPSRKSAFHPTCSTLGIAGGGIGKAGDKPPDRSRHQCACFRDLRMTADGGRISARRILLTAPCSRLPAGPTGPTVALVCDNVAFPCQRSLSQRRQDVLGPREKFGCNLVFRCGGLLRHLFGTCGSNNRRGHFLPAQYPGKCNSITFPRHGATTPTHHPRTPRSPESQLPSLESDKLSPRD